VQKSGEWSAPAEEEEEALKQCGKTYQTARYYNPHDRYLNTIWSSAGSKDNSCGEGHIILSALYQSNKSGVHKFSKNLGSTFN